MRLETKTGPTGRIVGVGCLLLAVGLSLAGCGDGQAATSAADPTSIYGWWDLVELDGQDPQSNAERGDPSLFIGVAPALNQNERTAGYRQLSGYSGCNGFGGAYSLEGDRFESMEISSTAMSCGDDLDGQSRTLYGVLGGATVEVADQRLSMVGDDGTSVWFRRSEISEGDGVYRLESIDGQTVASDVSLRVRGDSFSSYAGCVVDGRVFRDGGVLSLGTPVSMDSQTTTIPEDYDGGSLPENQPVDALFGCDGADDHDAAMLEALNGGRGVADGQLLTITSSSGRVLVLRHA